MDTPQFLFDRLKTSELTRIVAFGSSNTQRIMPGMHWFDCFDMACKEMFGAVSACINSGRGGDRTEELLERFERDCLDYRPHLAFVTVGGNDSNPACALSPDQFKKNYRQIIDRLQSCGCRPVLQTYYAVDMEAIDPEHARMFGEMMQIVRDLSRETDCMLIDHLARWERLRHKYEGVYRRLMRDAMHVNSAGNLLLGVDIARAFVLRLPEDPCFREALATQALLDELAAREANQ